MFGSVLFVISVVDNLIFAAANPITPNKFVLRKLRRFMSLALLFRPLSRVAGSSLICAKATYQRLQHCMKYLLHVRIIIGRIIWKVRPT